MRNLLFLLIASFAFGCAQAQVSVQKRKLADPLFIPWGMAYDAGQGLWFTQKNGWICRLDLSTGRIDSLYQETEVEVSSEGGMLDLVLHPDFPRTPFLYVAYNYRDNGIKLKVMRYLYFPATDRIMPSLTLIEAVDGGAYHNGCRLAILDEKLYITTGEAGKPGLSQDLQSWNGKTLRIELDGRFPVDNPVPSSPIWSWGHRNAQGMAIVDGLILQSEHGPDQDDEINWVLAAGNYGWPEVKGFCDQASEQAFCRDSNVAEPLYTWTPTLAVGDLVYYDHPMFPEWQGCLLLATLKAEKLMILRLDPSHTQIDSVWELNNLNLGRLRSLEIGPLGQLYLGTSNSPSLGNGVLIDQIWELYNPQFDTGTQLRFPSPTIPKIFPNPAKEQIMIQCPMGMSMPIRFRILEADGRSAMTGELNQSSNLINLQGLPSGSYFLHLESEGRSIHSQPILKQ